MTDTATATPQCEAKTGVRPGEFGFVSVRCGTTKGLRTFVDGQGNTHYFCPASGHGETVALNNGAITQFLARSTQPMYEGMD